MAITWTHSCTTVLRRMFWKSHSCACAVFPAARWFWAALLLQGLKKVQCLINRDDQSVQWLQCDLLCSSFPVHALFSLHLKKKTMMYEVWFIRVLIMSVGGSDSGFRPYLPTLPIFAGDSQFHCPLPVSSRGHISPAFLPISDKIRFTQDCFHLDFNTATPLFGFHGSVARATESLRGWGR